MVPVQTGAGEKAQSLGGQRRAQDLGLSSLHHSRLRRRPVVKSEKVEQPVHEVEADFVFARGAETRRVVPRSFDAEDDFAVLEGEHIRRTGKAHELLMQLRHATIGNQNHVHLCQARQDSCACRQREAMLQGALRKFLQSTEIDTQLSLGISHSHLGTAIHKLEFEAMTASRRSAAAIVLAWSSVFNLS